MAKSIKGLKKAKKAVKISSKKVSAISQGISPFAGLLAPVIIALIIVLVVSAVSLVINKVRTAKKAAAPVTITQDTPADQSFITIKDKNSDKSYRVPIKPASAAELSPRPTPDSAIDRAISKQATNYNYLLTEKVSSTANIRRIDIDEAKFLFDSGKAVFVDARARMEYDQGHIRGSVSLPVGFSPEDYEKVKSRLNGKVLVTYCNGVGCRLSDKVAARLLELKYDRIAVFFGGWPKWNEHRYPIASNPLPTPTPIK